MGKSKKKKKYENKRRLHYDPNSFFLDDVLKEIKEQHKERKKEGLTTY